MVENRVVDAVRESMKHLVRHLFMGHNELRDRSYRATFNYVKSISGLFQYYL